MKSIYSMIATLALGFVFPAAATAGINDPQIVVYRVAGVNLDGTASTIVCTPFSGVNENFRFVIRDGSGNLTSNQAQQVAHLGTTGVATMAGAQVGTAAIAATSNQVICHASAGGTSLRMMRFNPVSGTEE